MDAFIQFFTSADVTLSNKLLEVMYILIGLVSVYTGVLNAKDSTNEKRVGSAVFWIVLGVLFIFGKWIPAAWTGALLFVMVIPAIAGQVDKGKEGAPTTEEMQGNFEHIGMKIFAPAICIGLFALLFALFTKISSLVGMTFGVLVGAVLLRAAAVLMTRRHREIEDGRRSDTVAVEALAIKEIFLTIFHVAWRDGLVQLALYASTQATSILSSLFLGLAETGMYSILLQFSNAIYSFASAYPNSFFPAMQSAYAEAKTDVQRHYVRTGIVGYWALSALGTIGAVSYTHLTLPTIYSV